VPRPRAVLVALAPVLAHALAREADRGLGLVLRSELPPAGLLRELARGVAADSAAVALRLAGWLLVGALAWTALAWCRARRHALRFDVALRRESETLAPLWLRPALTLLALVAVAVRPSYPYGFTLPVALTQDWSLGQDAAALATMLAIRLPRPRLPTPRGWELFLVVFLGYALMVPAWAWQWDGHPGNEPKYLRQAVALGHFLSFDAEGVSAPMEQLPTQPPGEAIARAAGTVVAESRAMVVALARGGAGRDAIRATRITRQTVRGKDGGVFYVLAPGPSLMLAPTLRLDRAIDITRGVPGRVAVSVLLWCALAALLVVALFRLLRDATGRRGVATAFALGFALLPPFLFYFFQFYPEMIGALVLAVAFRRLALCPDGLLRRPWPFSWLLAALPWLHQKFLPVWAVLAATALVVAFRLARRPPTAAGAAASAGRLAPIALALLVPQALSLCLFALYNFAITGSVRADALFLAWGPAGVTGARVGQGLLGLLLDARYGILPWVPLLMLAAAGLVAGGARRFAPVLPAAAVYYLTVASADNWAGAVCNLGRYFMPIAPLAVALAAVAVVRETAQTKPSRSRRGALALALVLAAWSGLFALALWRDPLAANDSALLLAKSVFADGNQYIPNLFVRHWSDAAPGLWARVAAWLVGLALLAVALRRVGSPWRALAGVCAVVLATASLLERWPSKRTAPVFPNGLRADAETLVLLEGDVRVREDEAVLGPGRVDLLVRRTFTTAAAAATETLPPLRATIGGSGVLRSEGLPPLALRPSGGVVDLPLSTYHVVLGGDGRRAVFGRLAATVSGQAVMRFGDTAEPDPPRLR
jgi:hypothetical protein